MLSDLRTFLLADTAIAAVVGDRVFEQVLPQGTAVPSIRIWIVDGKSQEHLEGGSGLAMDRVQVDCYASTPPAADSLSTLVRLRLQGHIGAMADTYVDGIVHLAGPRHGQDQPTKGSDQWRFITSRDFEIAHQEAT